MGVVPKTEGATGAAVAAFATTFAARTVVAAFAAGACETGAGFGFVTGAGFEMTTGFGAGLGVGLGAGFGVGVFVGFVVG